MSGAAVCKFYQTNSCRFGDRCKNIHPGKPTLAGPGTASGPGNPFSGPVESRLSRFVAPTTDTIKEDVTQRPEWPLSSYAAGKDPPAQLIDGADWSPEEARMAFYETLQTTGNPANYQALFNDRKANVDGLIQKILTDLPGCVKFLDDRKDGSQYRYGLKQDSDGQPTPSFGQPIQQASASPFGQPATASPFGQPATPSPFGQPAQSQPQSAFGQPAFGQPSQPQSAFGAPSTPAPGFGGQPAFGQPSQPQSGFGAPSAPAPGFGQPAFGQASAPKPAFGQPAFGQPAFGQTSQPQSAFGQPSQPSAPAFGQPAFGQSSTPKPPAFGQPAFGQSSMPSSAPAFGQPAFGQPSQPQGAFGQPAFGQPAAQATPSPFAAVKTENTPSPFGQPSQPQSAFGQPSQPAAPAFGQPAFGQPSQPQSGFGKPSFGQPAFGQPTFGQPAAPAATSSPFAAAANTQTQAPSPFGQPTQASPQANPFMQNQNQQKSPVPNPFGNPPPAQASADNPFLKAQTTTPSPFAQAAQTQASPFGAPAAPAAVNPFAAAQQPTQTQTVGFAKGRRNAARHWFDPEVEFAEDEKKAFEADFFEMGKVPMVAPALTMCWIVG